MARGRVYGASARVTEHLHERPRTRDLPPADGSHPARRIGRRQAPSHPHRSFWTAACPCGKGGSDRQRGRHGFRGTYQTRSRTDRREGWQDAARRMASGRRMTAGERTTNGSGRMINLHPPLSPSIDDDSSPATRIRAGPRHKHQVSQFTKRALPVAPVELPQPST
ncbi:hypothetical protein BJ912DRAFT_1103847 [Pholiota molesta]|nr:hypothetical protein BJ912DRAFT_1103847 [Pholiota molesta]